MIVARLFDAEAVLLQTGSGFDLGVIDDIEEVVFVQSVQGFLGSLGDDRFCLGATGCRISVHFDVDLKRYDHSVLLETLAGLWFWRCLPPDVMYIRFISKDPQDNKSIGFDTLSIQDYCRISGVLVMMKAVHA